MIYNERSRKAITFSYLLSEKHPGKRLNDYRGSNANAVDFYPEELAWIIHDC
jgi:hypothetical protein